MICNLNNINKQSKVVILLRNIVKLFKEATTQLVQNGKHLGTSVAVLYMRDIFICWQIYYTSQNNNVVFMECTYLYVKFIKEN